MCADGPEVTLSGHYPLTDPQQLETEHQCSLIAKSMYYYPVVAVPPF